MPVLDTSFLIAAWAEDQAALRLLDEIAAEPLVVPAVVAVEFLSGISPADHDRVLDGIERRFTHAHTSREWASAAAQRRIHLRRQGRAIRTADFWISCWADLHDTYVITRNVRDFEALGVKARGW